MKILIILLFCVSCSSFRRTMVYSSLAGGVSGATAGALLSPNQKSRGANALVFGLLGAGIAAGVGYLLYEDDPRNFKLDHMLIDPPKDQVQIDLDQLKIDAKLEGQEKYAVPLKDLPEGLSDKVSQQFLIKYQSKERFIKSGNKTFYVPSFDVYEHAYENINSEEKEHE